MDDLTAPPLSIPPGRYKVVYYFDIAEIYAEVSWAIKLWHDHKTSVEKLTVPSIEWLIRYWFEYHVARLNYIYLVPEFQELYTDNGFFNDILIGLNQYLETGMWTRMCAVDPHHQVNPATMEITHRVLTLTFDLRH